jgi:hypothetical protein
LTQQNQEEMMRSLIAGFVSAGLSLVLNGALAFANEPKGGAPDYSGISGMYYTLIGVILAYGVYDTFFKKS